MRYPEQVRQAISSRCFSASSAAHILASPFFIDLHGSLFSLLPGSHTSLICAAGTSILLAVTVVGASGPLSLPPLCLLGPLVV